MPPVSPQEHFEILLDVRDRTVRIETELRYVKESLENGETRMENHSNTHRALEKRIGVVEVAIAQEASFWSKISEPIRLVGVIFLTLAATALWEWVSTRVTVGNSSTQVKQP